VNAGLKAFEEVGRTAVTSTATYSHTHVANGNVLAENTSRYGYDALNRLTSWYDGGKDATSTYDYDGAGNLLQVTYDGSVTETYSYDQANQIANPGYAYDENGNLTADGNFTYRYDVFPVTE